MAYTVVTPIGPSIVPFSIKGYVPTLELLLVAMASVIVPLVKVMTVPSIADPF